MSKKAGWILGITAVAGLVTAGVFYFKRQYELLMQYTVNLSGVKVLKISKDLVVMQFTMRMNNKSNLEATVKRVYGEVFLKGENVGFFNEAKGFVIPTKGESDIPIEFSFSPQRVLKNAAKFLLDLGLKQNIDISVSGYAGISVSGINLNLPYEYKTTLKDYLAD